MQNTSTAWKQTLGCYDYANRPNLVPISQVEVRYTINDPAAQAGATATDNGHTDYSNVEETLNTQSGNGNKYASLEHNSWVLDGTWGFMPAGATSGLGFVSSVLAGADCVFTSHPVITLTFDMVYTTIVPGLTITWSAAHSEMARDFVVRVYDGETLVNTFEVTDNTAVKSVVSNEITGYDKIEVEIIEWCLPNRRARIEEIIVGAVKIYDGSTLMGYSHTLSADLLSFTLPDNSIVFDVSNVSGEWNPDNPQGLVQYLMEQQEITVRYGYKINGAMEWIKGGVFYMSDWETPSNGISTKFTARSLVDFMGKKYTPPATTTMTLFDLATDALTQAGLPHNADDTNKWSIDASLSAIEVTLPTNESGEVDFDYTIAEVVQLCANAACCVASIDRDGNLIIKPLASVLSDYLIDQFVSYSNAEYSLSKPLKSVSVNDGEGIAENGTTGEVQEISNVLVQNSIVGDSVAAWVKNTLAGRKTLSGEFRPDPRLDVFDRVTTQNKYATNTVIVTSVKYEHNGAFHGSYEGRVVV